METPPLPHLSGTPPVPRVMKRAHFALVLSAAAWAAFVASIAMIATLDNHKRAAVAVPLVGWRIGWETVAAFLFFSCGPVGLTGLLLGLSGRKTMIGKAASLVGGSQFGLWALVIGVALLVAGRGK